ncbi:phage/plasmid primase, P4 family [Lactobacillus johnsonii]|uniref:phage/plasmid primase, P4 family n=1 Tax=Lactobacillus johnsonii TaxID=33959 RepID=UPI001E62E4B2|nr:phage/plasmid primase, P4 family [Lactobacillus johnsonii]
MTIISNLPEEIKKHTQWCVYKIEPPQKEGQHERKIPINPITGNGASSSDPNTWVDFDTASRLYKESNEYDGLGFFFNNDYIGIDIDDIPEEIKAFKDNPNNPNNTINWLNRLTEHSYLEVSQSGNGIHAIVKGSYPYTANRKDNYEIYGKSRFFALTGDILNDQKTIKTINKNNLEELFTSTVGKGANRTQKLVEVKQEQPISNPLSIEEIINKMYASSKGVQIKHLMEGNIEGYDSNSEADMSLCNFLAFWTSKDPDKMDAIFRKSKLMRSKWDEKRGAKTYGQSTIEKAIQDTPNVYTGELVETSTKGEYNFEFNEEPETIQKLKEVLTNIGIQERKSIQEELKQSKSTKKPKISIVRATKILEQYLIWAILKEPRAENWEDTAQLYFYNFETGIYDNSILTIDSLINSLEPQCGIKDRKEIKENLRIYSKRLNLTRVPYLFALGNCIFNIKTQKTINYSSKYVFTTKIPINYNPDAKEPHFNNWNFSKWINEDIAENDPDKIKLIWQAFKALINSNYSYHTALFLVDDGHGSTGKGTFEELLINIVGGNYATIRIKAFEKDSYLSTIVNKPLVIGDDNDKKDEIEKAENFKTAVTGDALPINPKFISPFSYRPTCLMVQSFNGLPTIKDNSDATYRRIRVLKFNKHYEENGTNRKVKDEYINNKELLEWIVKTAIQVPIDGILIKTNESNEVLKQNKIDSDPILQFIDECVISTKGIFRPFDDTYRVFKNWYRDRGKRISDLPEYREFNKAMKSYGFRSGPRKVKNRSTTCWLNLKLNSDCDSLPDFEFNK